MGLVASLAISCGRLMRLLFFHPCLQTVMAGQAKIRALSQKKFIQFRFVRAVALRTLIGENGFMFAFPLVYPFAQVFMTGKAERSLFMGHDPLYVASVGIMAGKAFRLRKWGMIRSSCHLFHPGSMTLSTHLRGGPIEQILFIRTMGRMTRVTVGIYNGLMCVSVRKFRFCICVTGIANPVHAVLQNALEIGP